MLQDLTIGMINKRSARIAVSALFFLTGFCFASWASRISDIQQSMHLNDAGLGSVLLALPVGSLVALPVAGVMVSRFASRHVLIIAGIVYAALLPVIGLVKEPWELISILVLFGFSGNMANIAVNTQAVVVEAMYGRSIMASFHGLWSVGGFAGASVGAFFAGLHLAPVYHFLIVTAIGWIIVMVAMRNIVQQDISSQSNQPLFVMPDKFLLMLGIIAMCSMICEGTMFDWSVIYFKRVVHAEDASGIGYSAFMSTMFLGRFMADWLTMRLGTNRMLLISGTLTAGGLLLAVALPYFVPAIIGFMLVGAGVSSVVPLVYSSAGKSKVLSPGMALAAVSTIGYLGFVFGPPLIGFVAQASSLAVSFSIIAVMGAAIALMSLKIKL